MLEGRQDWSEKQLRSTLKAITNQYQTQKLKIFFFIDGLDEIEGDMVVHEALVELIQNLVLNESIKAVVSSRPDQPFSEYLSKYQKLRLQDLTSHDIYTYTFEKLLKKSSIVKYKVSYRESSNK